MNPTGTRILGAYAMKKPGIRLTLNRAALGLVPLLPLLMGGCEDDNVDVVAIVAIAAELVLQILFLVL